MEAVREEEQNMDAVRRQEEQNTDAARRQEEQDTDAARQKEQVLREVQTPPDGGGKKRQGISGSALKFIAIVTMLIDHIGAAVVMRVLSSRGFMDIAYSEDIHVIRAWFTVGDNYRVYIIYEVMRQIGRTAFPIYCFLLVEGLWKTRNVWKYALRLGVFALVSEIPFDLAFNGTVFAADYQNVFFTLAIGLLTMAVMEKIAGRTWKADKPGMDRALKTGLCVLTAAAGMGVAALLQTDYGWRGVACILLIYLLRKCLGFTKALSKGIVLGAVYAAFVVLLGEVYALPAFVALAFYRGKKGIGLKYFFYGFYPVHLLVLYLVCVLMGIAGYPAL